MNIYRTITSIPSQTALSSKVQRIKLLSITLLLSTLLSIMLLSACASLPMQRFGEPQRHNGTLDIEASEAYLARYPFSKKSDLKRLELAMVYLSPNSSPHNEAKGRNYLWQVAGHEQSPYSDYAVQFLELQTQVERLQSEMVLREQLLDRQITETARFRSKVVIAEKRFADQSDSARQLQVELQSARARLRQSAEDCASKDQEIERLARELSELRRIDTRQAP